MAVSPMTYRGYDANGNCVSYATASDATSYIDPAAVAAAVDKVQSVATEEIESITNALGKLTEATEDSIIVQGTKMTGTLEDVITGIKTIPGQVGDSLADLKTLAQAAHDKKTKFI